jgi:hypothetical protein
MEAGSVESRFWTREAHIESRNPRPIQWSHEIPDYKSVTHDQLLYLHEDVLYFISTAQDTRVLIH